MFTRKQPTTRFDPEIDALLLVLDATQPTDEVYQNTLNQITQLHKMKEIETPSRVDPNTLALITANLIGIAMVIRHEHVNVITTKAFSMVLKPR